MARKHAGILLLTLAALMSALLLTACDNAEKYPGQSAVTYEVNPSDKPIIINVLGNDKKYLSVVVTIDITNKDDIKLLTEKNHWIRDIVIEKGRSKTLEQLQSANIMEELSGEIAEAVSEKFSITSIYKVSFPTFYLN